ncbi:MAG: hypothetical protein HQK83_08810 [Fibrobacteria bacterium]|nr:hypothetical protein [Fibrobacteria bacterium]
MVWSHLRNIHVLLIVLYTNTKLYHLFFIVSFLFLLSHKQAVAQDVLNNYTSRFEDKVNFNENWSYQIALNDGLQLYIDLSRLNKGKEKLTTANLVFIKSKNESYQVSCQYPAPKYFQSKTSGPQYSVRFHKHISFTGDKQEHSLSFFRNKKNIDYYVKLRFSKLQTGAPFIEKTIDKRSRTACAINFPFSQVSGIVAIAGDTLRVSGSGSLDHTYHSDLPVNLFSYGIRFFNVTDTCAGIVLVGKNKNDVYGSAVTINQGAIKYLKPLSFDKKKQTIIFDGTTIRFHDFQEYHKWSVLDELPGTMRKAASLFTKDLINSRGTGKNAMDKPCLITKIEVK